MVAVGAVIEDGRGRLLLVKHVPERRGFGQGRWICPGGRLNEGEEMAAGARREVKEETNLEIELVRPLVPFERIVKQGAEVELHVIYIDYMAKLVGGELRPASDVGQARWVEREELLKIWPEVHEDTQRLLCLAGIVEGA